MTAFQPWSTPGCTAVVDGRLCGSEATVTLSDEWGARRVPERRTR